MTLSINRKKRFVYSLVWSVAQHGSASWTLKKEDEKRIHALEVWEWRRMLRKSLIQKKTNIWVRDKVGG